MTQVKRHPRKTTRRPAGAPAPDALRDLARRQSGAAAWAEALASWQELSAREPDDFESWYRQAQSLFHLGHIDPSIDMARHAWTLAPQDPRPGVILSRALHRSQLWREAAHCWQRVLFLDPASYEAAFRLAQALASDGQSQAAMQACQHALELKPGDAAAAQLLQRLGGGYGPLPSDGASEKTVLLLAEARDLSRQKSWDEARQRWQQYGELTGHDFEASFRLGQSFFEAGNLAQARKWLDRAVKLREGHEEAAVLLARVRRRQLVPAAAPAATATLGNRKGKAQNNPDLQLAVAHALAEKGELKEAGQILAQLLKAQPTHEAARVLERRIRRRANAKTQAGQVGQVRQVVAPPPVASDVDAGRAATASQDWPRALEVWRNIAAQRPDSFEAWYRQAQASLELGKLQDAIQFAQTARTLQPAHITNLTLLGRALQRSGSMADAMACWQEVLQVEPGSYEAEYRQGQCLAALSRFEEAAEKFLGAQLKKPEALDPMVLRANALVRLGLVEPAIACWQTFIDAWADHALARKRFASFLRSHGRSTQAEQILRELVERKPDDTEAAYLLGQALAVRQAWPEVIELLSSTAGLFTDEAASVQAGVLQLLARALDAQGRLAEAESHFRQALQIEPDNTSSLTRLGRVLRELGKPDEAVAVRRRACEVAPAEPSHWQELVFLLASLEREGEARDALRLAEAALEPTAATLAWLGRICESALFLSEARGYFQRAVAMDPALAQQAGMFYVRQGMIDDALIQLSSARDLQQGSVETARALMSQLQVCEMFGMGPEQLAGRAGERELLLPELLFESLAQGLTVQPRRYEAVPGRVVLLTGSLAAGGAERQLVTTIRGLVRHQPQVESVTLLVQSLSKRRKKDFYLGDIASLPVEIRALDVPDDRPAEGPMEDAVARLIGAFPDDMRDAIGVWYREFVARRPAVVHAWQDTVCLMAVVAAALAGVPRILLSTRSTRPDNPRRRLKRYMQRGYKAVMQLPHVAMLNNSQAGAADYEDWLGLPAGTVAVIHNGLDFDRLLNAADPAESAAHRQRLGIPEGAPVVGGVFRMSEEKRPLLWVQTAAQVLRKVPDAHFVVAGDGPMRDDMLDHARQLGMAHRLHLPGHVSVPSWFLMMDVVLLTSRMEGLPNVLLEAQSFGIPVVAPAVGGVAETIEQGSTGWAVPDATADSLAQRIVHMLKSPAWYRKARSAAARFAKEGFSVDAMVGRTLQAYGFDRNTAPGQATGAAQPAPVDVLRVVAGSLADGAEGVEAALARVLAKAPEDVPANLRMAQLLFGRRDYAGAVAHLSTAVALAPQHTEAWRWLARAQAGRNEVHESLVSWRRLLVMAPGDFEGLYRAGEAHMKAGSLTEAAALLDKALGIVPGHEAATRVLARVLQGMGQVPQARDRWLQLLGHKAGDFEALYRAGQLCLQLGDAAQGEDLLGQACRAAPADFNPCRLLARHLMWDNRLRDARRLLVWHLAHGAQPGEAAALLGQLLRLQGREALMQRLLQRGERAGRKSAQAALAHAQWLVAWGDYTPARQALKALALRSPKLAHRIAIEQAGMALTEGDFEQARQMLPAGLTEADARLAQPVRAALDDYQHFINAVGPALPGETLRATFLRTLVQQVGEQVDSAYAPRPGFVMHMVNSLAAGGTERQSAVTAVAQKQAGAPFDDVVVVRTDPATAGRAAFFLPYLDEHGVKTATLAQLAGGEAALAPLPGILAAARGRVAQMLGVAEIARMYRAILALRPAVIHTWTPQCAVHGAIAGLLAGTPRMVLRGGSVAPADRPFVTPEDALQFAWFRDALRAVLVDPRVRLVNNCKANLDGWLAWLALKPSQLGSKPMVIYNAMDFKALGESDPKRVAKLRSALQIPKGARVVGGVMRLEPEKGLALWLDTVAALHAKDRKLLFLVVGDGRSRQWFEKGVRQRGMEAVVHIARRVDSDAMADYYALMDVLLLTSLIEGLPNVILEAQWFGVPIVATRVGGVSEAVGQGAGCVVNPVVECLVSAVHETPSVSRYSRDAWRLKLRKKYSASAYLEMLRLTYREDTKRERDASI
jgi:glycosyltransferase involved in cell wall biosynthesis/tetratricopeptide (TPR) repeat protein